MLLQVLHHLGRPVRLVHVVAVPTVVAVEGVAARPGHHILVDVAPGLEHGREAQPARRWDRRASVARREALLLLEQIHAEVVEQPHPLAGVVIELGVDPGVEPGRQLGRQPTQGGGEQDPAQVAPAVLPRQPQPKAKQLDRRQGAPPGRVGDRRFDPVAHPADPGPRFVLGDETPLGSAGAGHPHRGELLAQLVGVSRSAAEVRGIPGGTDAHCHAATVRPRRRWWDAARVRTRGRVRVRTTCPRDRDDAGGVVVRLEDGVISKAAGTRRTGEPRHPGRQVGARLQRRLDDPARPAHHAAAPDRAHRGAGDGGWAETTPPWACCGPCSYRGGPLHAHDTGTRSLPAGAFQLRFFHRQPALMQGM